MIRINLIGIDPHANRGMRRFAATAGLRIAGSLILFSTAATIGWWHWSLREASRRLDIDLSKAEADASRGAATLADLERLERRRAELQQRVTTIEQLRGDHMLPAILDGIAAAVPGNLWLLELALRNDQLTLKGVAPTLSSVSRLAANLEASGLFRGPIEIVDTEKASQADSGELVRFSIKTSVSK